MIDFIGLWSHALAALLYGALAVWQLRHWNGDLRNRPLVAAFAVMSVWAIFQATAGPDDFKSHLAESARNLAFLTFMYGIVHGAGDDQRQRAVKVVYGAVASVIGLQIILALLMPQIGDNAVAAALNSTRHSIGLTIAAGSLVLVHNLYAQVARNSRWGIRLPVIALAALWAYDLHLYTVAYLTRQSFNDLFALRGITALALVPLFAMATRRNADWRVQLSRTATFQSLSLLVILGYFVLMVSATRMLAAAEGEWVRLAQVGIIFAMTLSAALLVPSDKLRAWLRVLIAKHFFEHRYDYREDWLRFTRAVGRASGDGRPIEERVVKALADIAGSGGGLLLMAGDQRHFRPTSDWNWAGEDRPNGALTPDLATFLEKTEYVIDFSATHGGSIGGKENDLVLPEWLSACEDAWAGVPLVHNGRLVALALLRHPSPPRPMDWEDFDLFRTAGIQAASYLAEAQSQEALGHAQRFEEFNRRFAFIMHDIKNLVSQLSLVTRNAERHADNPEFRADMIATLQSSVKKMNDLLARLSGNSGGDAQPPRPVALPAVLGGIVEAKRRAHPVELACPPFLHALADPSRLEQAVAHLVQNAIDASPAGAPVRIAAAPHGSEVAIEVRDSGTGMSAEFVRTRLFQPFASTKETGFGVGAFEAKTLIEAMDGRIEVDSREGEGTSFTVYLPASEAEAPPQPIRISA